MMIENSVLSAYDIDDAHTSLLLALALPLLLLLLLDKASGSDTVSAACTGTINLSILCSLSHAVHNSAIQNTT
jgi:hypothetical protein